jgi:hypothetical protein
MMQSMLQDYRLAPHLQAAAAPIPRGSTGARAAQTTQSTADVEPGEWFPRVPCWL